jgi:carbonic anhydrase
MSTLEGLLTRNREWAAQNKANDPEYFNRLVDQQSPEILWIGCADSRVPANTIIKLPPGEVFVHRNIANVVVHSDLNCLSVLQFAVEVLKVKRVILCGHYGCGGVAAALDDNDHGLIDNWLRHIKDVERIHWEEMDGLIGADRVKRLCELNVIEQSRNICTTTIVRNAWKRGQDVTVHGLIYGIADGLLHSLCEYDGSIGTSAAVLR